MLKEIYQIGNGLRVETCYRIKNGGQYLRGLTANND